MAHVGVLVAALVEARAGHEVRVPKKVVEELFAFTDGKMPCIPKLHIASVVPGEPNNVYTLHTQK